MQAGPRAGMQGAVWHCLPFNLKAAEQRGKGEIENKIEQANRGEEIIHLICNVVKVKEEKFEEDELEAVAQALGRFRCFQRALKTGGVFQLD